MFNRSMKRITLGAALALGLVSGAFASGGGGLDYSTLTSAIDVGEVGPAILTAAAALIGMYLAIVTVRKIIAFVRSA